MKMRLLHSFLISLNAHLWGVVLLSAVFVFTQKEPEPQRIEVQLLKLPAPLEGTSLSVSGATASRSAAESHAGLDASRSKTTEQGDRRQESLRKKRGPRVEYRVRVAKTTAAVAVRESGTWAPASSIRLRRSEMHASGSRISGVSPEARATADRRPPASGNDSMSDDNWPLNIADAPAPDGTGPLDGAGGDTRELIEIIQARIDAVTPLIHASAGPCQTLKGIVHLKFFVNRAGYPGGFRIVASSGVRCLDAEIDNVLHMAEPYPFVAGWIPVTVRFAPRTSI